MQIESHCPGNDHRTGGQSAGREVEMPKEYFIKDPESLKMDDAVTHRACSQSDRVNEEVR